MFWELHLAIALEVEFFGWSQPDWWPSLCERDTPDNRRMFRDYVLCHNPELDWFITGGNANA